MRKETLIVIAGPTGVGKTSLSLSVAEKIGGEIISADSMQVYRGMDIGTAKISREARRGIPHHLMDVVPPTVTFDISQYQKYAQRAMEDIRKRCHIPLLVGGTGFYIQAVVKDICFSPASPPGEGEEMTDLDTMSHDALFRLLRDIDPASGDLIHPNNKKRVLRAIRFYYETGQTISSHNAVERKRESPYNTIFFVLTRQRDKLYAAINARVDEMMSEGFLEEVKALYDKGCRKDMTSMQGIGYKELLDYLENPLSLNDTVALIKKNTRHYAKRQLTWFKREENAFWINKDDYGNSEGAVLEKVMNIVNMKMKGEET